MGRRICILTLDKEEGDGEVEWESRPELDQNFLFMKDIGASGVEGWKMNHLGWQQIWDVMSKSIIRLHRCRERG
jgi:hypothetical protein